MALKQSTTFKGLTATDSYLKITLIHIFEKISIETGQPKTDSEGNKLYTVNIQMTRYNSDSKEYVLETEWITSNDLIETDLKYNKFYNYAKNYYNNSKDC